MKPQAGNHFILWSLLASFAAICSGCRTNADSRDLALVNSPSLKPYTPFVLTKPLIGFNWSTTKSGVKEFIAQEALLGREQNAKVSTEADLPQLAQRAFGLYIANDPYLSNSFGNVLSCIVIKASTVVIPPDLESNPPADPLWYVKNPAAVSIYDYSGGLVPMNLHGDAAAVIRDPAAFDFSKSARISFETDQEQDKLSPDKIKLGLDMLANNNPCAAYAAFERNELLMIKSLLASVDLGALKTSHRDPIRDVMKAYLNSRTGPSMLVLEASRRVAQNADLLKLLIQGKFLKAGDAEKAITVLLSAVINSPGDLMDELDLTMDSVPLIVKLINASNIIHVYEQVADLRALESSIANAFAQTHQLWASSHAAEVGLMKQLWQKSMEQSLSSFLVEQGFER